MIRSSLSTLFKTLAINNESAILNSARTISTSSTFFRDVVDRKEMLRSLPATDEGTVGEKNVAVDSLIYDTQEIFPTADSMNKLFDGVPFKDLPVINIRVTHNNTILTFTDAKGVPKLIRSCGVEGFKNARKGTNIAAQTTAITLGTKTLERGVKTVSILKIGL